MTDFIDVPVTAADVRQADRIVPEHGTVRVAVAVGEHLGRVLITWVGFDGYPVDSYAPGDTVTLRCPTVRGGRYAYYAERQPDGTVTVYRHVGCGRFAAVLTSYLPMREGAQ